MTAHPSLPAITWDMLSAELLREHEARGRLYPALVEKLRMTADQAVHGQAVILAIRADLARMQGDWHQPCTDHAFTWTERRNALLREAAFRAKHYPAWIAEGRFSALQGDRQRDCIEVLLRVYENGFDWRPSNGLRPVDCWHYEPGAFRPREGDDCRQARAELHAMLFDAWLRQGDRPMAEATLRELAADDPHLAAELEARLHPPQQKELAL